MKNVMVYIKNAVRGMGYSVRYGSHLKMGLIQSFERIRIDIAGGGHADIGSFCQNREKLYIGVLPGGRLSIGEHCFFNINASITCCERIEIGSGCKFGNNVVIIDHDHNYRGRMDENGKADEFISSPVIIGNNVWVGANVVILRGTRIGDDCVIGAGCVIKNDVPAGSVIKARLSNMQ